MAEGMKYSVIIPVYNAENTIERCLDSLLNQIPNGTELLVINDGSKDRSGEICWKYAERNANIRYFEKANGGVSSARNMGLDNASGEYILFADSDDYVTDEYWPVIDALIKQYHPDMLQFGFRDIGKKVTERNNGDYIVEGVANVADKVNAAVRNYMFSALYGRTYKREYIKHNNLRFNESIAVGEDQIFIFEYAMYIGSLVSTSAILYNAVLDNQESLTRKKRDYLTKQLRAVNDHMFSAVNNAVLPNEVKKIYQGSVTWVYYRSVYSCCKELIKYDYSKKERRKEIKEICSLYASDNIKPLEWKCRIIAVPVLWKMSLAIDYMINRL